MSRVLTPGRALVAVLALAFAIRLFFVTHHQGYWGVDGGAYLLNVHYVLTGEQIQDFKRPWLAPGYLLAPFVWAFGADWGLKVFSLVAWLPMLFPAWLLARQGLSRWQSVAVITGIAFGWMLTEMWTAGVLPELGFTALLFAMWGIWNLVHTERGRGHWQHLAAVTLGMATIPYLNQTTTAIALYVLPVWALAALWLTPQVGLWRQLKVLSVPCALGVLLAIPAVPFYLQVTPGSGLLRYPGPLLSVYSAGNAVWEYSILFLPVALLAIGKGNRFIKAVGILLLVSIPIGFMYSYDEAVQNIFYRTRYLYTIWFYICAVWLVAQLFRLPECRQYAKPAIALALVVLVTGHVYQIHAESKLGRMVTPETAQAIDWLNQQEFRGAIGTNSYSMSLYVAALTGHQSPWLQVYEPPPAYHDQHYRMVCVVGWRPGCDVQEAVNQLDVDYVLAERLWPANGVEIARKTPGLGTLYRTVEAAAKVDRRLLRVEDEKVLGKTWDAPAEIDPHPWDITEQQATWLEPVWEKGTTKVWRVKR